MILQQLPVEKQLSAQDREGGDLRDKALAHGIVVSKSYNERDPQRNEAVIVLFQWGIKDGRDWPGLAIFLSSVSSRGHNQANNAQKAPGLATYKQRAWAGKHFLGARTKEV